jgi:1-acyl-sn-glycerol-3-phosphate acyltransferase
MLTARRSKWFERLFRVYNRNLLRRRFDGLRVAGLKHLRERQAGVPLVLYANHSSWWDGLVAFEVGMSCRLEQYVMMEERQLREYALFRRLGAFSVVREDRRAAGQSIDYAAGLLSRTQNGATPALWIFPQGDTRANDLRPLKFYRGAAHIALRLSHVTLLPVAMRYEHRDAFRPDIFVRVGAPEQLGTDEKISAKHLIARMEENLTRTLDRIRADTIKGELTGYEELIAHDRRGKRRGARAN